MPSGLALCTDVYHRNNLNRKDCNQANMNNMGMERGRMQKEPDNQFGDFINKICTQVPNLSIFRAIASSRSTYDIYKFLIQLAWKKYFGPVKATAKIDRKTAATIPYFPDNFGLQQTFTWTGGEDILDCDKSTVQVQPSVESSSNASASHYEIMTASRDKGPTCMAWDPCVPSPTARVFKWHQHRRANIVLERN